MLIQSNVRLDRSVVSRAIDEARSGAGELTVLVVLDPAIPEKVAAQFTESGHIGPRPSEGFLNSLYERHEQLALEQAREISNEAESSGVRVRTIVRRGDYPSQTASVVEKERPQAVVIEKRRRSLLRFTAGDRFMTGLQRKLGFRLIEV